MSNEKSIFVEANEVEIAQLASRNVVSVDTHSRNYCVVTDKRIYHKGVSFASNVRTNVSTGESVIDLKSVTATSFSVRKTPFFMFIGILMILAAAVLFVMNIARVELPAAAGMPMAIALAVVGLIFVILYFALQKKVFSIFFGGNDLSFHVDHKSVKALREFATKIHEAKEYKPCTAPVPEAAEQPAEQTENKEEPKAE